ncbi:MAG: hypothetical protein H0U12_13085 [Thermoleophilaceae bacterium]|nr:hypothetical protein [Thermoleophilaceae bacterium]
MVLVLSLLVGGFALLSSVIVLVAGQSNTVEWALYLLTLTVLVPAAITVGRHLAGTLEAAGGPTAVSGLAARAAAGLLAVVLVSRSAYSFGWSSSAFLLPLTAVWAGALVLTGLRVRRRDRPGGGVPAPSTCRGWIIAAALGWVCVLGFLPPELLRPLKLAGSLVIAGSLTALHLRRRGPGRRRSTAWMLDATAVVLVLMTMTDVSGYLEYLRPDARTFVRGDGTVLTPEIFTSSHRHHQGFWLGPLNEVVHGQALLVDVTSQYGVGVLYFLAVFFQIAPLGYGSLSLAAGFLTAVQYALIYGIMRFGGCPRTLAVAGIAAAVFGLVAGAIGSPADYPSIGALRFGIPWLIVALAVLSARWQRHRAPLRVAAAALVGIASVWSFETFVYASAVFAAVVSFEVATLERYRVRTFGRDILAAAGWCVIAHLALAVATRILAGSWPDWSTYLALLRLYSAGDVYRVVAEPWSPGLPLLLLHLASAIGLAALLMRRRKLVLDRRPLFLVIAAASGLGIASFSYFVGQSDPNALIYSALPAVVEGGLWAALVGERLLSAGQVSRVVATGAAFWLAALLAISGWPDATVKWRRTALAHTIPAGDGEGSLGAAVLRLWRSPPSDPRALIGQALLARNLPPGETALVIAEPELSVETLVRSGRANALPISHPEQDNLVPDKADSRVIRAVNGLSPGTLMLIQRKAVGAPTKLPGRPPDHRKLVRLQKLALDRIRARFLLEEVERSPSGLAIVRLLPRPTT